MRSRGSGWAGICGGLLYLFFGAAFVITHGSTTVNRNDTWLGFDNFDYGELGFVNPILFLLLTLGFERSADDMGKRGKFGIKLTQVSLALQAISHFITNNMIDLEHDWRGPIATNGWILYLFSVLLLLIGMLLWGLSLLQKEDYRFLAYLLITTVVCLLATFVVGTWISKNSDGSRMWEVALGLTYLPVGLCWISLGVLRLSKSRALAR